VRAPWSLIPRTHRRASTTLLLTAVTVGSVGALGLPGTVDAAQAAATDVPIAVAPYSGFNPSLTRAPYVSDLTQVSAYINWGTSSKTPGSVEAVAMTNGVCPATVTTWSSSAKPVPTSLPGPVNPTSSGSSSSMTAWTYSVVNGAGTTVHEYQSSVALTGLQPSTRYCYTVFSTDKAGAVDLLPSSEPYQTFTTLDPVSTTSTASLTFDVIDDTGDNYYQTAPTLSGDVPFPGGVNPDQAALYREIGQSGARFLLSAGDMGYSGGTESTYGDLEQTGTVPEVSTIFGPSYFPQTSGIPTFAADGAHNQNVTNLRVWPTPQTATASGGTYAFDSYTNGTDNISGSFPDDWYAFSTGNVRIYVLDGSWAETSTRLGDTTGSLCPIPSPCKTYQADADEHWQPGSAEYQWLARDLAAHRGGLKFAVFHYPLRSDNATEPSDPYLQNSSANPNASTSLEHLLASNGVDMSFNGHAHIYQRTVPTQAGQLINYVTGGGGGVLAPVLGGKTCQNLLKTESIYALGWSPNGVTAGVGQGSYCGPAVNQGTAAIQAATPQSAADVYSFLKVTVTGNKVTVTPMNAAGKTFDVQTYTFAGPEATVQVPAAPPPPRNGHTSIGHAKVKGTTASVRVSCTGPTGAACKLAFRMTVTEKRRGHKIIAITARKKPKIRKVVVTVGSARGLTLVAGQSKVVKVSLNGLAKRLLASRHTLKVTLDVTQILSSRTSRTFSQTVTFKAPKHKKHHH
jgi:Calcineurin-like phosphoesterase